MMFTRDLKARSPFKDLFPIRENVLNEIVRDMKKNGYDHTRPIVLWQGHKFTVLDGHTRLEAAKLADIFEVPVEVKSFETEEEALEYTIHCQRNRRNLTDQEIVQCVSELDKRKKKGGDRKSPNAMEKSIATGVAIDRSSDETAKVLGVNRGKVEKARTVLEKASDEIKKAVKSGKMSINKAYNKTVKAPESLDNHKDAEEDIKEVMGIVKKRLSLEQIRKMIELLHEEGI